MEHKFIQVRKGKINLAFNLLKTYKEGDGKPKIDIESNSKYTELNVYKNISQLTQLEAEKDKAYKNLEEKTTANFLNHKIHQGKRPGVAQDLKIVNEEYQAAMNSYNEKLKAYN